MLRDQRGRKKAVVAGLRNPDRIESRSLGGAGGGGNIAPA
jgi:hypothetical protein